MLILFKPWRTFEDLKSPTESWEEAFDRTPFSDSAKRVMKNMNVENECKDAKDKYEIQRRAGKVRPLLPGSGSTPTADIESLTNALERDAGLDAEFAYDDGPAQDDFDEDSTSTQKARDSRASATEKAVIRILNSVKLWDGRKTFSAPVEEDEQTTITTDDDRVVIAVEAETLKAIGRDKRPALQQLEPMKPSKRQRLHNDMETDPVTSLGQFEMRKHTIYERNSVLDVETAEDHLQDVLEQFGIIDNTEQTRAVRMVAEHFMFGLENQLLLYVAGVGGSGKSFIIKTTIVEFFKRCG
ncbi:hypothetical protein C8F04DRAFT_895542, partial [Mycena alexandri]